MRPKERRDSEQKDLFRARLDQIVDMTHPLAKLAATIDRGFLEQKFGAVYSEPRPFPRGDFAAPLLRLKNNQTISKRIKGR